MRGLFHRTANAATRAYPRVRGFESRRLRQVLLVSQMVLRSLLTGDVLEEDQQS